MSESFAAFFRICGSIGNPKCRVLNQLFWNQGSRFDKLTLDGPPRSVLLIGAACNVVNQLALLGSSVGEGLFEVSLVGAVRTGGCFHRPYTAARIGGLCSCYKLCAT